MSSASLQRHARAERQTGAGTGVLAAVLARRGVHRVVATDNEPRAIACAAENFRNLGVQDRAEAVLTDMFPPGRAPLIVCNPPWIPATPHSTLDNAVYDPGARTAEVTSLWRLVRR